MTAIIKIRIFAILVLAFIAVVMVSICTDMSSVAKPSPVHVEKGQPDGSPKDYPPPMRDLQK